MARRPERVRAWVLLGVKDPYGLAARIEKLDRKDSGLLAAGGDRYVIVRADVVEGGRGINLVVPIDAGGEVELREAVDVIAQRLGGQPDEIVVLRVAEHHPEVVHRANSFITPWEHKQFPDDFPKPGRQVPNSPGANPWG
jgi:hypothetical protein